LQSINNKPKTVKDQIRQIIKKPKEKFLTFSQKEYWEILEKNQITLCFGPAGTGKSHISIKKAIDLLYCEDNKYEKLIIIRSPIESSKSIGYLPGDIEEKMAPYINPTYYLLNKIIGKESRELMEKVNLIEIIPISFLRGRNIDNSIVIGEEFQNVGIDEMKLVLTRIGYNSKFFLSGDIEQSDLFKDKNKIGLFDAKERLRGIKDIGFFEFNKNDIVRNPIISEILERYNN